MTFKNHDDFKYKNNKWVGIQNTTNRFVPKKYGIILETLRTMAGNNFKCYFHIKYGKFLLVDFLTQSEIKNSPLLNGIALSHTENDYLWGRNRYVGVNLLIKYTGSILLGIREKRPLSVPGDLTGLYKTEDCIEVVELIFKEGILEKEIIRKQNDR